MERPKFYLAQPEFYPDQAQASVADGLFFYDQALLEHETTLEAALKRIFGRSKPTKSIAVAHMDTVTIDGAECPRFMWEHDKAALAKILAAHPPILFVDGYERLVHSQDVNQGTQWLAWIRRSVAKYSPGTLIHLMGITRLRTVLKHKIDSFDIDPTRSASFRMIELPNGERLDVDDPDALQHHMGWMKTVGMTPAEVKSWDEIVEFNIRSYAFCLEHFRNATDFKLPKGVATIGDPTGQNLGEYHGAAATSEAIAIVRKASLEQRQQQLAGLVCDNCRKRRCDMRVEGQVCPKTPDFLPLIRQTGTRDADEIREDADFVQGRRLERLQRILSKEEDADAFSPDVSREASAYVKDEIALAKLADPGLDPKPPNININAKTMQIAIGLANRATGGELNAAPATRDSLPAPTDSRAVPEPASEGTEGVS